MRCQSFGLYTCFVFILFFYSIVSSITREDCVIYQKINKANLTDTLAIKIQDVLELEQDTQTSSTDEATSSSDVTSKTSEITYYLEPTEAACTVSVSLIAEDHLYLTTQKDCDRTNTGSDSSENPQEDIDVTINPTEGVYIFIGTTYNPAEQTKTQIAYTLMLAYSQTCFLQTDSTPSSSISRSASSSASISVQPSGPAIESSSPSSSESSSMVVSSVESPSVLASSSASSSASISISFSTSALASPIELSTSPLTAESESLSTSSSSSESPSTSPLLSVSVSSSETPSTLASVPLISTLDSPSISSSSSESPSISSSSSESPSLSGSNSESASPFTSSAESPSTSASPSALTVESPSTSASPSETAVPSDLNQTPSLSESPSETSSVSPSLSDSSSILPSPSDSPSTSQSTSSTPSISTSNTPGLPSSALPSTSLTSSATPTTSPSNSPSNSPVLAGYFLLDSKRTNGFSFSFTSVSNGNSVPNSAIIVQFTKLQEISVSRNVIKELIFSNLPTFNQSQSQHGNINTIKSSFLLDDGYTLNMNWELYAYFNSGSFVLNNQQLTIDPSTLKWNVEIENWPFQSANSKLILQVDLVSSGGNFTLRKSDIINLSDSFKLYSYDYTNLIQNIHFSFPGIVETNTDGFTSFDTDINIVGSTITLNHRFPYSNGRIKYDPILNVVLGGQPDSSSTSDSSSSISTTDVHSESKADSDSDSGSGTSSVAWAVPVAIILSVGACICLAVIIIIYALSKIRRKQQRKRRMAHLVSMKDDDERLL